MPAIPFPVRLSQVLPPEDLPWVILALQRTPTLWEALQRSPEWADQALEALGEHAAAWTPGHLARLLLGLPATPSAEEPPPDALRREAAQAYTAFRQHPRPPREARRVALLSLVLSEQRRVAATWADLPALLGAPEEWTAWREPFAAAFSLAEDRRAMLHPLLQKAPWEAFQLGLHALAALPQPPAQRAPEVAFLLQEMAPPRQLQALAYLTQHHPELLPALEKAWQPTPLPEPQAAWAQGLLTLPHQPNQAQQALSRAWDLGRRFQAQVAAALGHLAHRQGDLITAQTAWDQAAETHPENPLYLAHRVLTAIALGHLEKAYHLLPEQPDHPALSLAAARLALARQEPDRALDLLTQALEAETDLQDPDLLAEAVHLAREMGHPALALRAARRGLQIQPARAQWHTWAAQAAQDQGALTTALTHALTALHLDPAPQRQRDYAAVLSQAHLWPEALEAWRRFLAQHPNPELEDRLALGQAALQAGHPDLAQETAQGILEQHADEARALALLSEALAAQGKPATAEGLLRDALQQNPQSPDLHLALVRVLQHQGKDEEALEALRLAAQSLPQEGTVQAALGRMLLQRQHFAQALPVLQKAHQLLPRDPSVALDLGRTLLHLQRLEEAVALLRPLAQRHPGLPGLAELLGQALLRAGKPQEAMPILAQALQQGQASPQLALGYAAAVLAAGEDPRLALQALAPYREAAEGETLPEALGAEILLTLGQAWLALKDPERALQHFRQVLTRASERPLLALKATKGLARAALAVDDPSVAIAALEEMRPKHPEDEALVRLLAQAYAQAGLAQKALKVAAEPFRQTLPTPQNALWYADLAFRLGHPEEAIGLLTRAKEAHPGEAALHLRLAEAYLSLGRTEQAVAVLTHMLHAPFQPPLAPADLAGIGERLLQAGHPTGAIQALTRALEAQPQGHPTWWLTLIRAWQRQGDHATALKHADQALYLLDQATLEGEPGFLADLHLARAQSLAALARTAEAQEALRAATQWAPSAAHWRQAGEIYAQLGAYLEALTCYERALQQEERWADRVRAAYLAWALMQTPKALNFLRGHAPEHAAPSTRLLAHLLRVSLASERGRLAEAQEALERAQEILAAPEAPALGDPQLWHGVTQALKARLDLLQGDPLAAWHTLQEAQATLQTLVPQPETAPAWEAAFLTAADLWQDAWALSLASQAHHAQAPHPRLALRLAQALVKWAERRPLRQQAEALLPQEIPVPAEEEAAQWEKALLTAAQGLGVEAEQAEDLQSHPSLGSWAWRGVALWKGGVPSQEMLTSARTPEEVTAALLTFHRRGEGLPQPEGEIPHQQHPWVQAALALLTRHPAKAAERARRAAEGARGNAVFYALWGRLALQADQAEEALQAYQAALNLWGRNPQWHQRAAEAAALLGERGEQIRHLEQAHALEPTSLQRALALAQVYAQQGQSERALEVLRQVRPHHEGDPDLLWAFAQVHQTLQQPHQALRWATQAHQAAPQRLDILLYLAQLLLDEGQPQKARQLLQGLAQAQRSQPQVALLEAQLAEALGQPEEALQILERAAEAAEDPVPLLTARAHLLARTRGPQQALEAWQALVEIRPDAPALWVNLAEALAAAGQVQAAQQAIHKALAGMEELPPTLQARLHLTLGRLALRQGHLDQAVHHLTQSVAASPSAEAYLELGRAEAQRQRPRQALQALARAMELDPHNAQAFYHAGLIYRDLKDYPQAERLLRRAAQQDPQNAAIRRALAAVTAINLLHAVHPAHHEG